MGRDHQEAPSLPLKHKWRCAGFVIRINQFDSGWGHHILDVTSGDDKGLIFPLQLITAWIGFEFLHVYQLPYTIKVAFGGSRVVT